MQYIECRQMNRERLQTNYDNILIGKFYDKWSLFNYDTLKELYETSA